MDSITPFTIHSSSFLQTLKIVEGGAKITIAPSLSIQNLQLPGNSLPSHFITNYTAIQDNIQTIQNASGAVAPAYTSSTSANAAVSDPTPEPTPVATPSPTPVLTPEPTPAPTPVNHAPVVQNNIDPISALITSGVQNVDISNVFIDPDGDPLTFAAASSDTSVATVSVNGNHLNLVRSIQVRP